MAQLIRIAAVVTSGIVILSFAMFANEQLSAGSKEQVAIVQQSSAQPAPSSTDEQIRERNHGSVHESIDDADDVLLAPFAGLVSKDDDVWAQRLVPGVLALLVYGVGLMLLANFLPKPSNATTDWREAGTYR